MIRAPRPLLTRPKRNAIRLGVACILAAGFGVAFTSERLVTVVVTNDTGSPIDDVVLTFRPIRDDPYSPLYDASDIGPILARRRISRLEPGERRSFWVPRRGTGRIRADFRDPSGRRLSQWAWAPLVEHTDGREQWVGLEILKEPLRLTKAPGMDSWVRSDSGFWDQALQVVESWMRRLGL